MLHTAIRWIVPLFALFVLGPIAGYLTAMLRASDASTHATLLTSANPMMGAIAGAGCMALAAIAGAIGSRLIGSRTGLFCAGLVLVWAAWGTGRVDMILGRTLTASTLYTIALEGVLLAVLGLLVAFVITRTPTVAWAKPAKDSPHHHPLPDEPTAVLEKTMPLGLAAGAIAAGVVVFLLAQDTLKGQTFAAACVGGVFAAAAGRMATQKVSAVVFVLAIGLLAAAAPAIATIVHGSANTVNAAIAGKLFALARPVPMDYLAGAFAGIPIGLGWAGSMIEKHGVPVNK